MAKDIHSIVSVTGEAREKFNALELVRTGLLAMGAKEPLKMWGDSEYAQGVYTAKQQLEDAEAPK